MEIVDRLRVLVVDDDPTFVETLVDGFKEQSTVAVGVSDIDQIHAWTTREKFSRFDMIFLDMRLGASKFGATTTAAELLLHIGSYCPTAKSVVFTQEDLRVEECVRCIRFGALGFVPKSAEIGNYVLLAEAYRKLGDEKQAMEERLHWLWRMLQSPDTSIKGRLLEMFVTNLFNSIPGFRVITNNVIVLAGEIDMVVENGHPHTFWKALESSYIVIECKDRIDRPEKAVYINVADKVKRKGGSKTAVVVSWSGVSKGFRELQRAETEQLKVFVLDRDDLYELIRKDPEGREVLLRQRFEMQF